MKTTIILIIAAVVAALIWYLIEANSQNEQINREDDEE